MAVRIPCNRRSLEQLIQTPNFQGKLCTSKLCVCVYVCVCVCVCMYVCMYVYLFGCLFVRAVDIRITDHLFGIHAVDMLQYFL
jgi:hypothetical protein